MKNLTHLSLHFLSDKKCLRELSLLFVLEFYLFEPLTRTLSERPLSHAILEGNGDIRLFVDKFQTNNTKVVLYVYEGQENGIL